MKSRYKPFSILRDEDNPSIDVYSGEIRRDVSVFPWWNHWPVAQKPTDGRWAMHADRPSHSSLSHWFWGEYAVTERSMTKLMLTGFTDKKAEDLLPLAKSWSKPAKIKNSNNVSITYNQAERCFDITQKENNKEITFEIQASEESPVINPAFVLRDWGSADLILQINGKTVDQGQDFRVGYNHTLNGTNCVSWLRFESVKPFTVTIKK